MQELHHTPDGTIDLVVVPVRKSLLEIIPAERINGLYGCAKSRQHWVPPWPISVSRPLIALLGIALFNLAAPVWAGHPGQRREGPRGDPADALPFDQDDIRELQHRLELTSNDLRAKRWSASASGVAQ